MSSFTLQLTEAWPGVYRAIAPYSEKLNAVLKAGIRWFDYHKSLGPKAWYIPKERIQPLLNEELPAAGIHCSEIVHPMRRRSRRELSDHLLPHQRHSIEAALTERVRLLQFGVGTGKTLTALETASQVDGATLIVAPRVVLPHWHAEIAKWGYFEYKEIWEQRTGRKIPEDQPDVVLVSYGSLHTLPPLWRYDCLIYDELHYAIHQKSKRSQALAELSMKNGRAIRLGLTATPTSAESHNIHGVMHALCPHRWGSWYQWTERFHETDQGGYEGARRVHGLRQDKLQELSELCGTITDIVTQADLGDRLPPVTWSVTDGKAPDKKSEIKNSITSLKAWNKEQERLTKARVAAVASMNLPTSTAIVCYLRKTAGVIGTTLNLPVVDGSIPPHKRAELLADAPSAVMTMMAINEGIDLRKFTNVLVVESYPVPRFVEQVLGRFVRLYATEPVHVSFLRLAGTSDTVISERLVARLEEQATLMREGKLRSGILNTLRLNIESDSFLEKLQKELQSSDWEESDDGW